jgi:hypothetical protein
MRSSLSPSLTRRNLSEDYLTLDGIILTRTTKDVRLECLRPGRCGLTLSLSRTNKPPYLRHCFLLTFLALSQYFHSIYHSIRQILHTKTLSNFANPTTILAPAFQASTSGFFFSHSRGSSYSASSGWHSQPPGAAVIYQGINHGGIGCPNQHLP